MRKLVTKDVFSLCRCLKSIGIKDTVREISQDSETIRGAWDKGFDLLYSVFDKATEIGAEEPIYRFLAGPFEMSPDEVANLPLADLVQLCKQLAEENDLAAFFKIAAKSA